MPLSSYDGLICILMDFAFGKETYKDNTTGVTNDINYESTDATNKYVSHDVINDSTTDLAYGTSIQN